MSGAPHEPVLLPETLELLAPRSDAVFVDGTLGAGGHAEALLEATSPNGRVLGIDRDTAALELARARLARFGDRFVGLHGEHADLRELVRQQGLDAVDGVLLDLGVSSMQLDDPGRGFSFRADGPLDMRMDTTTGRTAAELVAETDGAELKRILRDYGEERQAGRIARAIVRARDERPIATTAELAELVARVLGPAARRFKIHPATRTFQALRIAVNCELDRLEAAVHDAVLLLRPTGRVVVLAYHSLEDRIVKHTLRGLAERCNCPPRLPVCGCGRENIVRLLTGKPTRPSDEEIARNPRSRSARLRAAERL
ncbi:MAG: 16S rRNA (cytosine(1402)-N(4))-methyltransferase RsmH [bacterium]|nr:16S rRNA (cytosine(1402)-N(4))-methyltransferase RsmH [bacterium]